MERERIKLCIVFSFAQTLRDDGKYVVIVWK